MVEHPFVVRLVHHRLDLLEGERGDHVISWLDLEHPDDLVRQGVEPVDDRLEHGHDRHHRRAEDHRRALWPGEREVLGHHLAQHDVQVDHEGHRDGEGNRVQPGFREVHRVSRRLDQVGQRRLGDGTEAQGADGDAELGGGDHL